MSKTRAESTLYSRLNRTAHFLFHSSWNSKSFIGGGMVMVVLMGTSFVSQADEREQLLKNLSYFQGNWHIESSEGNTTTTAQAKCIGSVGNCNIWIGESGTFLIGYDPKTKNIKSVGHFEDGSRLERVVKEPNTEPVVAGTKMTFYDTIWHPDGTITYSTVLFTCLGPDSFHEVTHRKDQDGKKLPNITSVLKRVK